MIDNKYINKAIDYILNHINDSNIYVGDIAKCISNKG